MKQSDLFPEADIIRDQEISKLQKEVDSLNRDILRANIPEEDQVQKKPDFLAKCMNIPMVSFAKCEVEGVAELICDHYCKFPELIKKEDILHRICEGCPLNALMTHIQGGSKDD